jgi:hypothetical protein
MNRVVRGRSRLFFAARGATRPDDALVNQSKNGTGRISARGKMKKQIFFFYNFISNLTLRAIATVQSSGARPFFAMA